MENNWQQERDKIIGLGENSFKKSYYPELQNKIEQLEASQKNLENILNSTSDSIIIHNSKGHILYINSTGKKLLNLHDYEKQIYTVTNISSPRNNFDELPQIWNLVSKGKSQTIEWLVLQRETLKEIPVQVSINNIIWNGRKNYVAVIRDFTLRKEYEEQLLKAKEMAEESNQLKTAFLQNMSHEIRTPMNAIIGFSDLLNDPALSHETRTNYTSIIIHSSKQLLNIVNNVLTMASIETKQEKAFIQATSINSVINELFAIFNTQTEIRKLTLHTHKGLNDIDAIVYTDYTKLVQILTNLLNNAIKFTHKGKIEFGYVKKNDHLEFFVKDTGIGILPEYQDKIFERFRQADRNIQLNYGGNGLGLSISKEFVDLLQGKIWLKSVPNEGSEFYFTLKYNPVYQKQENNELNISPASKETTILIAEDEEFNYKYLETILSKTNAQIIHALNGQETVEICKTNQDINLILMDIKMPVMDGYTAARKIKEFRPQLPIIAQTAYAMDYELKNYVGNAFDDIITKPIDLNDLKSKIEKYLKSL